MRTLTCLVTAVLLATSCSSNKTRPDEPELSARQVFEALEQRLTAARTILINSQIKSKGAVASDLAGEMAIGTGNRVYMRHGGQFKGVAVTLRLLSDGRSVRGRGARTTKGQTPAGLNEALIIGCTRMGLLHNLAMQAGGQLPARSAGNVREWVRTGKHRFGAEQDMQGQPARSIVFDVIVSGDTEGEATLWLSKRTGLPLKRTQKVKFGTRTMELVESYLRFEVNLSLPRDAFRIQG